jgi:hypothetical protein
MKIFPIYFSDSTENIEIKKMKYEKFVFDLKDYYNSQIKLRKLKLK